MNRRPSIEGTDWDSCFASAITATDTTCSIEPQTRHPISCRHHSHSSRNLYSSNTENLHLIPKVSSGPYITILDSSYVMPDGPTRVGLGRWNAGMRARTCDSTKQERRRTAPLPTSACFRGRRCRASIYISHAKRPPVSPPDLVLWWHLTMDPRKPHHTPSI